jgi:hypothetical protein
VLSGGTGEGNEPDLERVDAELVGDPVDNPQETSRLTGTRATDDAFAGREHDFIPRSLETALSEKIIGAQRMNQEV